MDYPGHRSVLTLWPDHFTESSPSEATQSFIEVQEKIQRQKNFQHGWAQQIVTLVKTCFCWCCSFSLVLSIPPIQGLAQGPSQSGFQLVPGEAYQLFSLSHPTFFSDCSPEIRHFPPPLLGFSSPTAKLSLFFMETKPRSCAAGLHF